MRAKQIENEPGEMRSILSSWMRDRSETLTEVWAEAIVAKQLLPGLDAELVADIACVWLWLTIEAFETEDSDVLRGFAHRVRHGELPRIDLYVARRCFRLLEDIQRHMIGRDFEEMDGEPARRLAEANAHAFQEQYCHLLADQRCSRWQLPRRNGRETGPPLPCALRCRDV